MILDKHSINISDTYMLDKCLTSWLCRLSGLAEANIKLQSFLLIMKYECTIIWHYLKGLGLRFSYCYWCWLDVFVSISYMRLLDAYCVWEYSIFIWRLKWPNFQRFWLNKSHVSESKVMYDINLTKELICNH